MLDNLTGLVVFAKVVEEGGFSKAATSLGISKASVSKQVSALEDHLGSRLLNRTTRRISLTEPGTLLYERCRRIVAEVDAAEREAGSLQSSPIGRLRICAGVSFGTCIWRRYCLIFFSRFPNSALNWFRTTEGWTWSRKVTLALGRADLRIHIDRPQALPFATCAQLRRQTIWQSMAGKTSRRTHPAHASRL